MTTLSFFPASSDPTRFDVGRLKTGWLDRVYSTPISKYNKYIALFDLCFLGKINFEEVTFLEIMWLKMEKNLNLCVKLFYGRMWA